MFDSGDLGELIDVGFTIEEEAHVKDEETPFGHALLELFRDGFHPRMRRSIERSLRRECVVTVWLGLQPVGSVQALIRIVHCSDLDQVIKRL